jgi:hypothetical protein
MANLANVRGPNVKVMGHPNMVRLVVRGQGAYFANALTNIRWSKGPAVTILAKCEAGQVIGSSYEAIGGLTMIELPMVNFNWDTEDGTSVSNLKDQRKFTWPETIA